MPAMLQVGPTPTGGGAYPSPGMLSWMLRGVARVTSAALLLLVALVRTRGSLGLPERGTVVCLWASPVVKGIVGGWTGVPNLCGMS